MCTAIAAVMGLQVAGGLVQGQAAANEGVAKQNYYNWLATNNDAQAKRVVKAGDEEVTGVQNVALQSQVELERQARRLEGRQKTVQAKNGVWGNSRTAQDIAKDTLTQEGRDAAALRYNADVKSWEARTSAAETARALREGAQGYRMGGEMARTTGNINRVTSIIGTATNVGDTWLRWQSAHTARR